MYPSMVTAASDNPEKGPLEMIYMYVNNAFPWL